MFFASSFEISMKFIRNKQKLLQYEIEHNFKARCFYTNAYILLLAKFDYRFCNLLPL